MPSMTDSNPLDALLGNLKVDAEISDGLRSHFDELIEHHQLSGTMTVEVVLQALRDVLMSYEMDKESATREIQQAVMRQMAEFLPGADE